MNSEKVKEIKKALKQRTQHKPVNCSHSECVEACGRYCRLRREFVADMGSKNGQTCENCNEFNAIDEVKEHADILTLINELESENERLKKDCAGIANDYQEMGGFYYEEAQKNQQLKDKVTELESENERLMKLQSRGGCRVAELGIENQQLKDRIADLQEDEEKWQRKAVNYYQMAKSYGVECIIDNDIDELLKEYEE